MPLPVLIFPVEIRVFVGSSSVVMPERRIVEAVIEKINADHRDYKITLRGIFWENQGQNATLPPEEAIVKYSMSDPKDCHIGLYIFANWYGSPGFVFGEHYESATIWEYNRSKLRAEVELLVYRKNMTGTTLPITGKDDIKAAEQWINLVNFFNKEFHFSDGSMRRFYREYEAKDMETGYVDCQFAQYVAIDLIEATKRCVTHKRCREALATHIVEFLRATLPDAAGYKKLSRQEIYRQFNDVTQQDVDDVIRMLDQNKYVTCVDSFVILHKH